MNSLTELWSQASPYSVKAQVPEQRLHEDLSQVGVRMSCCGAVRRVCGGCEARTGRKYFGTVSRRAVAQERGHVGVVLQTGQDNVQLHPLWDKHSSMRLLTLKNTTLQQRQTTVLDMKHVHTEGYTRSVTRCLSVIQ